MSTQKVFLPGDYFATELTKTVYKTSVTSITLQSATNVASVSATSHGLSTGAYTTFSGVTGVTALNGAVWGPITRVDANTYTFPCTLTGSPGGTIIQEPLFFPGAGTWFAVLGANGVIEYNPDNKYGQGAGAVGGYASAAGGDTWRVLVAASGAAEFDTDGFSVRFRMNGTTATSYFSFVK